MSDHPLVFTGYNIFGVKSPFTELWAGYPSDLKIVTKKSEGRVTTLPKKIKNRHTISRALRWLVRRR
ncbi:MAG: hypothetical protein NZ937_00675 [Armatimonadetes bacterium]|nr:hypothetical protein [Armatimonadota bacterium]